MSDKTTLRSSHFLLSPSSGEAGASSNHFFSIFLIFDLCGICESALTVDITCVSDCFQWLMSVHYMMALSL